MATVPPPPPPPPPLAGFGMPTPPVQPPGAPPPPSAPPAFQPSPVSPRTPRTPRMSSPPTQGVKSPPFPGVGSPPPPAPAGQPPMLNQAPVGQPPTAESSTMGYAAPVGQNQMLPYMTQPQLMYAQNPAAMSMYPQYMPQLSMGGLTQPVAMMQPGMQPEYWSPNPLQATMPVAGKPVSRKRLLEFSYLEDLAYANGQALNCCGKIFHERGRALNICIPTAGFTVFFAVIAIWVLATTVSGSADTTLTRCKVLLTKNVKVKSGLATRYRPTLHVHFVGESKQRMVTRYRDPADYEVEFEEANRYLGQFNQGNTINCYLFKDGAVQLDDRDHTSIWGYIIVVVLCLFTALCYCVWITSGFYACCSTATEAEYQA